MNFARLRLTNHGNTFNHYFIFIIKLVIDYFGFVQGNITYRGTGLSRMFIVCCTSRKALPAWTINIRNSGSIRFQTSTSGCEKYEFTLPNLLCQSWYHQLQSLFHCRPNVSVHTKHKSPVAFTELKGKRKQVTRMEKIFCIVLWCFLFTTGNLSSIKKKMWVQVTNYTCH